MHCRISALLLSVGSCLLLSSCQKLLALVVLHLHCHLPRLQIAEVGGRTPVRASWQNWLHVGPPIESLIKVDASRSSSICQLGDVHLCACTFWAQSLGRKIRATWLADDLHRKRLDGIASARICYWFLVS